MIWILNVNRSTDRSYFPQTVGSFIDRRAPFNFHALSHLKTYILGTRETFYMTKKHFSAVSMKLRGFTKSLWHGTQAIPFRWLYGLIRLPDNLVEMNHDKYEIWIIYY